MAIQSPKLKSAELVVPTQPRVSRWDTATQGTSRSLAVWENQIWISIGSGDSGTLIMPEVGEAAGQVFFIRLLDDGSNNDKTITLSFPGDPKIAVGLNSNLQSANTWASSNNLTNDDDYVLLLSTGHVWVVLAEKTT